jgi:hypothetical protein
LSCLVVVVIVIIVSDEKNETEEINQLFENPDIDPSEVDRAV